MCHHDVYVTLRPAAVSDRLLYVCVCPKAVCLLTIVVWVMSSFLMTHSLFFELLLVLTLALDLKFFHLVIRDQSTVVYNQVAAHAGDNASVFYLFEVFRILLALWEVTIWYISFSR